MAHIEGSGGSCYLHHYDALRTKIDMWLTPNGIRQHDEIFDVLFAPIKLINVDVLYQLMWTFYVLCFLGGSFNKCGLDLGSDERSTTHEIICMTQIQLQSSAETQSVLLLLEFEIVYMTYGLYLMQTNFRVSKSVLEIALRQFHKLKWIVHRI